MKKNRHGNVRIDDTTLQQACFAIHQRGERVTNQRLKDELNGKGSARRIGEMVRWFNSEGILQVNQSQPIERILTENDQSQVIASSGAITQIAAGLESALKGREQQLEAEFLERQHGLEEEYQVRFAELEKQQEQVHSERELMKKEIEHLRQMDAGKNRAIEEYVNQLRVLEQKRTQAEAQMHALIEKQNQKEADMIQLENDLAMEKQRQSQLMTTISAALDEKYIDNIVLLESNIKQLEKRLEDANDSYEKDTAMWMNKYDATRIERDDFQEKYRELKQKQFKLEDDLRLNTAALTEKTLENNYLKEIKEINEEIKLSLKDLKNKDLSMKALIKANKQLLRKLFSNSKNK
ncbi:coiled-coil domain-containing protein [Piscirickettsia litoralis]|uniref:KfrA N-terminal DNA-binding domain-containing protein n=1 Tax=Piscirickettsia litoralis TaxID=1891921 RepID=A0ABX3A1S6_9GAMM|nr:hypothetical protein [Piscirickettsia litoralis]ODN41616.1 hypothetical protein BGC07_16110 [Piscirickettsia litoralis]